MFTHLAYALDRLPLTGKRLKRKRSNSGKRQNGRHWRELGWRKPSEKDSERRKDCNSFWTAERPIAN